MVWYIYHSARSILSVWLSQYVDSLKMFLWLSKNFKLASPVRPGVWQKPWELHFSLLFNRWHFLLFVSREFTHRVKSVSMAKFTSQEVAALQEGGNEVLLLLAMVLFWGNFACTSPIIRWLRKEGYFGVCFENKKPELAVVSCSLSILIVIFIGKHVVQVEIILFLFYFSLLWHMFPSRGKRKRTF